MRIKKGDHVHILSGKDKGKEGTVSKVMSREGRLVVDGVNMYKKRVRPKRQGQKGETVLLARPIAVSSVMLVCKNCKKPSRTGMRDEGNKKVRYCKKCEAAV